MNASIKAFARKGLKGTSMEDIVQESGLSKGAIYWYFSSKDDLIKELLNTFFSSGLDRLKTVVDSPGSATERLQGFLDLAVEEMDEMMKFRPVIQELYVLALRDKKIKKIVKEEFEVYHSMLESIINRGIQAGEFKSVEPHQVANSILSLMEGTVLIWSIGVKDMDVKKQVIDSVNFLIEAIRA